MSLAQICMPLKHKIDERAFLYGKDSTMDIMNSKIRKNDNKEIRKALENFKKSPDYNAGEDFVKREIENLDNIFPPRWKVLSGDIDSEDAVKSALSVLSESKLVDANLRRTIYESLRQLETVHVSRRWGV